MKFFHYIQQKNTGKGGITIAYQFKENKVTFSVAQCSDKGTYKKRTGRDVATEKFLNGETITLAIKGDKHKANKTFHAELPHLSYSLAQLRSSI